MSTISDKPDHEARIPFCPLRWVWRVVGYRAGATIRGLRTPYRLDYGRIRDELSAICAEARMGTYRDA